MLETDTNPDLSEHSTLLRLCGGNHEAVALIDGAWRFCEVWDDAIDGEKKQTDAEIHAAFHWALFELADNQFYRTHQAQLAPALKVAIAEWMAANELERSGDRERAITAYTLRCSPYSFFVAVVLAASGTIAAQEAALYLRSRPTADRLDAYLREHKVKD